jgi:RNA polymerase sigma-70 factor (ECF subfamily)
MDDAEDAAQEALLRAWRGWPALRDAGAVRTWLLRITVNVCRNWQVGHFGASRRYNASLADATHGALSIRDDSNGLASADALDLRQAITRLPIDLQRVIALRFYAGMNSTTLGALLDLPAATVRTRLRRALELLRQDLSASEQDGSPFHHTEEITHG